jgi:hypothetical protein
LALALGGEAGARLAGRLAMPLSADTLLRMAASTPSGEAASPRVVAVDDWAKLAKVPPSDSWVEWQMRDGDAVIATEPFWSTWSAIRS